MMLRTNQVFLLCILEMLFSFTVFIIWFSMNNYVLNTVIRDSFIDYPIEPVLKKRVISNEIVTVLKAREKHALADVNCYCKMTSVVALDGVTSFFTLKRRYICM